MIQIVTKTVQFIYLLKGLLLGEGGGDVELNSGAKTCNVSQIIINCYCTTYFGFDTLIERIHSRCFSVFRMNHSLVHLLLLMLILRLCRINEALEVVSTWR